ncbi:hypothetical protein [Streptomyces hygroscopicus]|uniref:hypothetical protein n=1 Tax=Streptomyces hygroscopicus TaxID=1912 RepID=UPI0034032AB4
MLPVTRWLAVPADAADPAPAPAPADPAEYASSGPGWLIGAEDLKEVTDAAEQARVCDAQFGGANWRLSPIRRCLNERALPLLDAGTARPPSSISCRLCAWPAPAATSRWAPAS